MAAQGRDFVRKCIEESHAEKHWRTLCESRHRTGLASGEWSPESEDYTWLETAFCEQFLKRLRWFGAMEYEWRSGPKPGQAGFWVVLWSKDPRALWWELQDEIERQMKEGPPQPPPMAKPEVRRPKQPGRSQPSLRF
jgi:hypothetical protein